MFVIFFDIKCSFFKKINLQGLIFAVFADFGQIREIKYPQNIL